MSCPQPRIAIKFGTKRHSNAAPPPSSLGKRQRPTGPALNDGSDSDGDDDAKNPGEHEAITGFGEEGAETTHGKPSGPRVIERLANGGRYAEIEERRRQQQLQERTGIDGSAAEPDKEEEPTAQYGLVVSKKQKPSPNETTTSESLEASHSPEIIRSAEDEAMDALLGKRPAKTRTILHPSDPRSQDIPEVSTIGEYEDTPIDDFGAALLRGMGWNGEKREAKPRERERRPNTMGIGSKVLNAKDDLGAWDNKGANSGSKKPRPTLEQYRHDEKRRREQRGRGGDDYNRHQNRERVCDRNRDDRDNRNLGYDQRDRDGGSRYRDRR